MNFLPVRRNMSGQRGFSRLTRAGEYNDWKLREMSSKGRENLTGNHDHGETGQFVQFCLGAFSDSRRITPRNHPA
ncbi:MAG: hypothetical protein LBU45_06830 [Azoarcus sp.]|nr:hypothetical protein [Azoarcus sp.]